ncbi:MAG: acyltransferase [Clostridium sp.]|nr:acyltransferase [Clostridium sp.]
MSKYLSSKIKVISFIAIIMVVFTHCYNFKDNFLMPTTIISEGLNYGTFIEYFICNGLSRTSVPIFFIISGYLFFVSFRFTGVGYIDKLKSRVKSLLIPYIIWTVISMGICFSLWDVDIMPVNDMIANLEVGGLMQVFLNPPNFQFWFVKQLIIYVVLSPIIYLLIRFGVIRILYLSAMLYLWSIDIGILFNIINVEALFYFSLGAYLAILNKEKFILKERSKKTVITLFMSWIIMLVIKTILCGIISIEESTIDILILHKVSVVIGIVSMWFGLDYIMKNDKLVTKTLKITSHTFFIFCFHEPLLDFVIQYSLINICDNTLFNVLTFFIYPIVTIILSILISKLLLYFAPSLHNILTGGRGTRKINYLK